MPPKEPKPDACEHEVPSSSRCKKCEANARSRAYRARWPERRLATNKRWATANPEKKRAKDKRARDKLRATLEGRLNHRMEVAIRKALGKRKNGARWETLVGYTTAQLQRHIEKLMPAGMTWQDVLSGRAEIDHVLPKSCFRYDSHEHPAFRACWGLTNLRPIWRPHNRGKAARLELVA